MAVPLAVVIPEWLGPGGNHMTIQRWGEQQKSSRAVAIVTAIGIWSLFPGAAIGFGLMGRGVAKSQAVEP
jgi:hypothetical protein